MTDPLPRKAVTAAVVAVLDAAPLAVGDGRVPVPQPAAGHAYWIVYELPSSFRDVGADGVQDGASLSYQITSVGQRRDQVTAAADLARATLTPAALQTALGAGVLVAQCDSDGPPAAVAIRGTRSELFNAPETFTVSVFRAP